ncbi:MAG: Gfo/Idh/MocA family oxidoreductase [Clostridia bacterium]|nr:Gfo/Idh/MocA family oxidoreductase [Clostridia bacterium]
MVEKVKILCVGIGGYATIYLKSLLKNQRDDFEIVGMVEIFPERCECYRELKALGVPLFGTMEEFYQKYSADLAIITTPIHLHKPQILCALKNGSNVMCEKPLSGVSADEQEINAQIRQSGKFVIIGYQWSYSKAINALKSDIINGLYGSPEFLKSLVLWPRAEDYFTRGSGWAGRLLSPEGEIINDSVVNNATAHFLHNMLYVTGKERDMSSEVISVECDLSRTNKIENFDTAAVRFTLDNGARGLFLASHATETATDPIFEYRFSKGTVTYDATKKEIIGKTLDGNQYNYGNPFYDANEKIYEAIKASKSGNYVPVCGVSTAAAQVRCVEKIQKHNIHNIKQKFILRQGNQIYADGLDTLLLSCYNDEKLLREYPQYLEMID